MSPANNLVVRLMLQFETIITDDNSIFVCLILNSYTTAQRTMRNT